MRRVDFELGGVPYRTPTKEKLPYRKGARAVSTEVQIEGDTASLHDFGQKSLDELVAKLDELGLSLPTSSDLDSGDMTDA